MEDCKVRRRRRRWLHAWNERVPDGLGSFWTPGESWQRNRTGVRSSAPSLKGGPDRRAVRGGPGSARWTQRDPLKTFKSDRSRIVSLLLKCPIVQQMKTIWFFFFKYTAYIFFFIFLLLLSLERKLDCRLLMFRRLRRYKIKRVWFIAFRLHGNIKCVCLAGKSSNTCPLCVIYKVTGGFPSAYDKRLCVLQLEAGA